MADRAVASAIQRLGDVLVQEATFLCGVRTDVDWLRSQLRWMEGFLNDADVRRRNGDERMKNWVREVREIAYEAEDVVDKFILRIESKGRPIKEFFRRHACILSDQVALHQIGNDISQIKLKIQNIRETRNALGIPNLGEAECRSELGVSLDQRLQAWRQTYHHLDDDKVVVGFEDSKKFILKHLLDPQVERRSVISIVGMGGTGKTTLAAKVYNSKKVKNHFNTCAWITVSQYCKVKDLLKNITTEVICGETWTDDGDFKVKSRLYGFLKQRRYFIVLDDIWEQEVWEHIKAAFPNESNGSRILLTTRFTDVAKFADPSSPPFQIPFLSQEFSWQLFLNVVFPSNQETISNCPKDLEELGHVLVKRCGGLPLALVVLGGLLSIMEPTINSWRAVAENMDWESTDRGKICLQILALSYNYLPHHFLKSCFLYLGCFPEDYCYKASELIRLWVAEGFIPQKENRKLEETANDYMDELVKRCMVTVAERSVVTGRVKTFKIHDLLHELCISEAKEDGFIKICSNRGDITDHEIIASRRLVINQGIPVDRFHHSEYKARSLLCFSPSPYINFLQYMSPGFNLLRVLVLHMSIWPSNLYENIFSLIHLRYLQLNKQDLVNLPSSIGKLRNLQTLDLRSTKVVNPPEALSKIQSLRHLYLGLGCTSRNTSLRLGRLQNLQTLKVIRAGPWIETELAKLSNIRKLKIDGVSVKHVRALSDSLHKLNHLTSLYLCTNSETSPSAALLFPSSSSHQYLVKLSLNGLWIYNCQLPQNLIKLSLEFCALDEDVIAMVEKLPSLTIFKMKGRLPQQMIFSAGGFPRLQKLHIVPWSKQQQMGRVPPWRIERGAMPNLTYLEIDNSNNLTMLPHGLEHVSSLRQLKLGNADDGIVGRLSTKGEDRHKIQHIPSVVIDRTPSVEREFFELESDDSGY